MPIRKDPLSTSEAAELAKTIATISSHEVSATIRRMLRNREFFRNVSALDDLLIEHPEHKQLAAEALNKMGLWHSG